MLKKRRRKRYECVLENSSFGGEKGGAPKDIFQTLAHGQIGDSSAHRVIPGLAVAAAMVLDKVWRRTGRAHSAP